eukprot:1799831-Prymnesium_polylepis.1
MLDLAHSADRVIAVCARVTVVRARVPLYEDPEVGSGKRVGTLILVMTEPPNKPTSARCDPQCSIFLVD